jgi:hypothetical protein
MVFIERNFSDFTVQLLGIRGNQRWAGISLVSEHVLTGSEFSAAAAALG